MTARADRFPLLAFAAYAVLFSLLALGRHYSMLLGAYDLGIFTQSYWNTLHGGGFFFNQMEGMSHFGIHFSPTLLVLMPFFALWQSADCLIVCQTLALALGVFPLYRVAARRFGPLTARIFVVLFLLYPPLHGVNYHEFHEVTLAVPLYLFALELFETRRYGLMWLMLVLALGVKEDQALVVIFLGFLFLWLGWREKAGSQRRTVFLHGALAVVVGAASYYVITHFVMPAFGGTLGLFAEERYKYLGGSLQEILTSPFTRPGALFSSLAMGEKIGYLLELFAPLAFLPLRSVWVVPAIPILAMNVLSAWPGMYMTNSHYASALIPLLFYSAVRAYEKVQRPESPRPERLGSVSRTLKACLVLTVLCMLLLDPAPVRIGRRLPVPDAGARAALRFMKEIPPDASLATLGHFYPHLCLRRQVHQRFREGVDYVFLDLSREQLLGEVGYPAVLASDAFRRSYVEARREGSLVLYRRKAGR